MSRMRRTMEQPLSLFSFQDIITSVTGVMVLLTLLLAVELMQRVLTSAPQQTKVQISASGQSISEMQAEVTALEQQLTSSGAAVEGLPSFDPAKLLQDRQSLEQRNQKLQLEIAALGERLGQKQRQLADAASDSASEQEKDLQELERLNQQIANAQQQLDSISSTNRIFFRKEAGGKRTWLVDIAGSGLVIAEIGVSAKPRAFSSFDEFRVWMGSVDPASIAFYLIVRPDGVQQFEACSGAIRQLGFDIGFHVMAADRQVIDPNTGAAAP